MIQTIRNFVAAGSALIMLSGTAGLAQAADELIISSATPPAYPDADYD